MLCYRGLGRPPRPSARSSFSAASRPTNPRSPSRSSRDSTRPEDNNERQPIHDHLPFRSPLLAGAQCGRRSPTLPQPSMTPVSLHRRHGGRGHQVHPQRRTHGQEVAARNHGRRLRLSRHRRRRLARHPPRQRQGPHPARPPHHRRPLPQQPQRHVHRRDPRQRPRRRDLRPRRGRRRLRQRRPRRRLHHRARRRPSFPQRRRRQVPRRDRRIRPSQRRVRLQRRLVRLRPRRQARPVRRQLCPVGRSSTTSGARSMAPRSRTARPSPTRARPPSSTTTWAAASSKTSPPPPASPTPTASRSASPSWTTTATAGPTSSSPTTPSPTSSTATFRTASSKRRASPPGVAFGEDGVARGAMGVDAGDYDRSGKQHLMVGNFSNQMLGLYHNEGNGLFVDEAPRSPIGRATLLNLTFGLFFFDYDLDGYPDIFTANGHIEEEIARVQPEGAVRADAAAFPQSRHAASSSRCRPSPGRWSPAAPLMATSIATAISTSSIANNNGPAMLYRNDGGNRNHWLRVRLSGTKSNRDGIGAVVRIGPQVADGAQRQLVLLFERSGPDVRPRGGDCTRHNRNRLAQRHAAESRQRQARPAPHHHRTMNEILTLSAVAQSKLIRDGEITSEELVRLHRRPDRRDQSRAECGGRSSAGNGRRALSCSRSRIRLKSKDIPARPGHSATATGRPRSKMPR